ncbi:intradiol ring-cleavage dioxygenase [Telluria mixta]|uniref:Intradiol ring-cleavage dioxygenase n=1 Tax=Telluria mixta TaxID=34071 RepID=A0ABT2BSX3_9BURK|nr:intradiol ring-cleavage dioxygenase [Telluria mixta]MCS0628226.1 intradiol ring-cleavage dioxygenase [Telluria mixta]WEM93660.1 intradiol ring-cleavage dioxygenase [Telluria mixta]
MEQGTALSPPGEHGEHHVQHVDEFSITELVNRQIAATAPQRLAEIVAALTRHLHDFAREVRLSESELMAGIQFLTQVGQTCDDRRQEFILLSDVLGLSMLVTAQNNRKPAGCTEATVFGPFHVEDSPKHALGDDIANGAQGEPCFVRGAVKGLGGEPVANARLEVWQADEDGFYDVQYAGLDQSRARATLQTGTDGVYHFRSILANSYPIPHDGPVGKLLAALGRHPWRPAHLHFMITADGYETLITHVFRNGDRYLESDAVFGVRESLIAEWIRHPPGPGPDGSVVPVPFYTLDFDFVLNPLPGAAGKTRN